MRAAATLLLATVLGAGPSAAQTVSSNPVDTERVGLTQNLDDELPLDLPFVDERGEPVALSDYFSPGRPVLLSLVYYRCPMLCNVVLQGLVDTLQQMDWAPGEQFEIVTVSIDPDETADLAQAKKDSILEAYGRPEAGAGWHFLTGGSTSIDRLADAAGFRYEFVQSQGEFAHPAALFVVTPDGRLSRYLLGVNHEPKTLRLSLVEAAEGKIGSFTDQFLLYCFRYDEQAGRYTPVAWRIMRVGGGVTLAVLGGALAIFWRRETRARRTA